MTGEPKAAEPRAASRGGRGHFYVAVGILALTAGGFHAAVRGLGVVLVKYPVPWPAAVDVDNQRLTSFPEQLGPYKLVGDGEWHRDKSGKPIKDGKPDGIMVLRDEMVGELDIANYPLNWYYSAAYRDTRSPRVFVLQVTYYTGLLDAVPHVPTACIDAGGGQRLPDKSGAVTMTFPKAKSPWDKLELNRVAYAARDRQGRVADMTEYYVFSMNGDPTASRYRVRGQLTLPGVKYCYFAKIQVAPQQPEPSFEKMDEECEKFLRHAMPEVLRFLPSAEDVEALYQADPADDS